MPHPVFLNFQFYENLGYSQKIISWYLNKSTFMALLEDLENICILKLKFELFKFSLWF